MDGIIALAIPVLLFIAIFSFVKYFLGQRGKSIITSRRRR